MGSVSWNDKLYSKMCDEQEAYKSMLLSKPPEEILEHAYEYSFREDIICAMTDNDLPEEQAAAILSLNLTMDDMFEQFSHNSYSSNQMDIIWSSIEERGKKAYSALMDRAKSLIDEFCIHEYDAPADFSDLSKVGVAYTTVGDQGQFPLQVYVDLENYKIERKLDGKPLDSWQYDTLVELIETELEGMDFQTLVSVSDEDIEKALALEGGDFR